MYYVLLSGGSGKRLWPLSSAARPKQYLKLVNKENNSMDTCSMLQRVWEQLEEARMAKNTVITAGENQMELIHSQVKPQGIVVEPEARDTFPAVMLACGGQTQLVGKKLSIKFTSIILIVIIYYFLCKRVIVLNNNCNHKTATENVIKIIKFLNSQY